MRVLGCVALLVAFVVGVSLGYYSASGEDPGFAFAVAMGAGLFCVLAVLAVGGDALHKGGRVGLGARLGIWVPVVGGLGFFVTWTEGLAMQVVGTAIGALVGLILPSALRRGRPSGPGYGDGGGGGDGG